MKPRAYYNEHEPFAAAWLRELIKAGHIADGDVDERDIQEVKGSDLDGYTQCHFFAGIGGWSYALRLTGWPDDRPVWTGSCPCQDFSLAGKRERFDGSRDLWPDLYRLTDERRPDALFGEQVDDEPAWWDRAADDLEVLGYTCGACVVPACAAGAIHQRGRLFFSAYASGVRPQGIGQAASGPWSWQQLAGLVQAEARVSVPAGKSGGMADGVPTRVGQLRGYGNAIVPQVAAAFIQASVKAMADQWGSTSKPRRESNK